DAASTPVEGGHAWVIGGIQGRSERTFIGAEGVRMHLRDGPPRRRVGLVVEGAPARQGAKIFDSATKQLLGVIPSPTLGQNIAMGYV
ncbi:hypothetical protein B0H17DRAFT_868231, partial [Mycena rosella]